MREPTEEQIERAVNQLVDHMREQLQRAEMDAWREACKRRLRSWMALLGLVAGASAAVD